MARRKGPERERHKHYRLTELEARLEEEIVRRYAERYGGGSQSGNAWFCEMLRREAKRWGIKLANLAAQAEGASEGDAPPARPRRRTQS